MKKLIAILLLLLTLGTNSFVKASLHYCGESITQIAFGNEHGDPCDCAETGNMDCCKDIAVKLIPFHDSVLATRVESANLLGKELSFIQVFLNTIELRIICKQANKLTDTGPPLLIFKQEPAFLSIFRI